MPLPSGGNTPWPPEHIAPILQQYAIWSAWYGGQAEQLAAIYAGDGTGSGRDTTGFFASESGGFKAGVRQLVSAVRRWFWGSRSGNTQQRSRLHVPIAGDIAAASADLLFSEPPTFTIPQPPRPEPAEGEDPPDVPPDPTQVRLDELIDEGLHATLLEAAEICAALGGVFLRIVWAPEVRPDRPWVTAVHPDVAVPEWSWGRLTAVTFWRELKRDGKLVIRHLERHEPGKRDAAGNTESGKILHGVYQGTADELGQPVSLADYPEHFSPSLIAALTNGNEILTGYSGLTVRYVPNMKPNRIWRNAGADAAYLGRSDYSGVEPLMDALDLVESSLIRDVDLGKARLIVPKEFIQSHGPGKGGSVDLDQEVYEGVNAMSDESGGIANQIQEVQFEIRVEQHVATSDHLKATIVGSAGYSAQTFGLKEDGTAVTATEVAAKNRRSLITRDRKSRYWIPELGELAEGLLAVDVAQFHTPGIVPQRPDVEFADAVSIDPLTQAQTLRELETAGAISTEEKVRMRRPDWDDKQVQAEVKKIREDRAGTGEDPELALAGHAGNTGQEPPGQE